MTEAERHLLQRLADEGKATTLSEEELLLAEILEADGMLLIVRNTSNAVITPKGRHRLAGIEADAKPRKKPFGFVE